jgi:hypothetical protein
LEIKSKNIACERIFYFINYLQKSGKIKFERDFLRSVNIVHQKFVKIKTGNFSFTIEDIRIIAEKYNLNVNWIFGLSEEMFRNKEVDEKR